MLRAVATLGLACFMLLGCSDDGDSEGEKPMEMPVDCEGRGEAFVAGQVRTSEDGLVAVQLTDAEPAPPAQADNFWTLQLTDAEQQPALGVSIVAVPYMVDHQHGTAPQIATERGDGQYELGPLALTMSGLWEITLQLTLADGSETSVVYSFCAAN